MVRAAALILILAITSSCDRPDPTAEQIDRASNQSAMNAVTIARLDSQVSRLEQEIGELRTDLARNKADDRGHVDAAISDMRSLNSEIDRLSENDKAFIQQIDYLRAFHGRGPMPQK